MDRHFAGNVSGTAPAAPTGALGFPRPGNPSTGTPATKPGPYWYHMITEELRYVIDSSGITPDHLALTQLKQALDVLYAPKGTGSFKIQSVGASVASNAMTVTLNQTSIDFRSATLSSGTVNSRTVGTVLSLTIPSGATLGSISGAASRIMILAIDNAGTVELAVCNSVSSINLDESGVISTTAISAAATSPVVYSQTSRINVPYRVVGYVDSTQAAAGTWSSAPTVVQGIGGKAMEAMSSLGYCQTWQSLIGVRSLATTYYNTTGRPIAVSASFNNTGPANSVATVSGIAVPGSSYSITGNDSCGIFFIVPPGGSYSISGSGITSVNRWSELR